MNSKRYDGIPHPIRKVTDLRNIIFSSCEMFPEVDAYLEKDKRSGEFKGIKYSQVKSDVEALGTRFLDMGLGGKKIAVIGETSYYWFLTYFAVVSGVGVIVPLDKNLPPDEVKNLVERSKASAIIYSKKMEKSVEGLFDEPGELEYFISMSEKRHHALAADGDPGNDQGASGNAGNRIMSLRTLVAEGADLVHQGDRSFLDAEVDADEMASLLFTSGTTGKAKGVMLSHKNIASNVMNMSRRVMLGENYVVLSILPTHHTFENTCVDWTTFYQGKTLAICEGIKYISKNMNEVHANCLVGVPLVFEKLHKSIMKQAESTGQGDALKNAMAISRRLKLYNNPTIMKRMFKSVHDALGGKMELFIAGGAAIDPEVIKAFEAMGIPMIQGYGMTECSPIIAVNQDNYSIAESVGRPMHGTAVRIDDPDTTGTGEIVCKGPSVMLGYYEDPEATEEVLRDGWLYTGDLGYMDENGFLYVTGRKKTVIVTKGGKNIFPEEIEEVLKQNELIKETLVHGVTDKRIGNVVITAEIQPDFQLLKEMHGEMDSSEVYHFFKDLVDKVNETLPAYKVIKRVNIREKDFEMTTTGKIKRYGNFTEGDEEFGSVDYVAEKSEEKKRAKEFAQEIKQSTDKALVYRDGHPVRDIRDIFVKTSKAFSDRIVITSEGEEKDSNPYTYGNLLADVNGLGTALINMGGKGKSFELKGHPKKEGIIAVLTVVSGLGSVTLSEVHEGEEACFTMDGEKLDIMALVESGKNMLAQGDRQFIDSEVLGSEIAIKVGEREYTHLAFARSVMAMSSLMDIKASDTVYALMPGMMEVEFATGVLLPIYRGASIEGDMESGKPSILFTEGSVLRVIRESMAKTAVRGRFRAALDKVNFIKAIGGGISRALGGNIREIVVAGELDFDNIDYFSRIGYDVRKSYASSIVPGLIAIESREDKVGRKAHKEGAIGHLVPGIEVKTTHLDIDGVGAIQVAGEGLTASDENGGSWHDTGDLGFVRDSYLFITGKVSDRFVGDGLHKFTK